MSSASKGPQRLETGFRNPAFWQRRVLYFANLKSLFFGNREQTEELAQLVGEIDSYGGRLASVLNLIYRGGENTLLLERLPDRALLRYFEEGLGLELPRIELMSHGEYLASAAREARAATWAERGLQWIDGYVTDADLTEWAEALGGQTFSTIEGSREGNNKTKLYQFVAERGLPTPDTRVARSRAEVFQALEQLRELGYRRAVVRAALGASGIGMLKVDLKEGLGRDLPRELFHGGPCLAQGWFEPGVLGVEAVSSPSVQLFLDDGAVHLFDVTDQILSEDSVHEGNQSPPQGCGESLRVELVRQAGEAGAWLHGQGYRGTASVDFLLVRRDKMPEEVYICEVNARITGATYPSVLGRHLLPGGAWLMQNLRLEEPIEGGRLLDLIDASGLLFKQGVSCGVVPINFNFDSENRTRKGQFLCLATSVAESIKLLDTMVAGLPFKTRVERD